MCVWWTADPYRINFCLPVSDTQGLATSDSCDPHYKSFTWTFPSGGHGLKTPSLSIYFSLILQRKQNNFYVSVVGKQLFGIILAKFSWVYLGVIWCFLTTQKSSDTFTFCSIMRHSNDKPSSVSVLRNCVILLSPILPYPVAVHWYGMLIPLDVILYKIIISPLAPKVLLFSSQVPFCCFDIPLMSQDPTASASGPCSSQLTELAEHFIWGNHSLTIFNGGVGGDMFWSGCWGISVLLGCLVPGTRWCCHVSNMQIHPWFLVSQSDFILTEN